MTRPLYSRALSLVLSLWLAVFLGESEWIVHCPAHGGGAHAAGGAAHGATSAATHDMAAHSHHGHGAPAPSNQDQGHQCSCPGPGCCPPVVAVVPGTGLPIVHLVAVHEARAVAALDRLADEPDYLLPPATAPPAAALAPAA